MISGSAETLINDPKARDLYFGEGFYMRLDQDGESSNGGEAVASAPAGADGA